MKLEAMVGLLCLHQAVLGQAVLGYGQRNVVEVHQVVLAKGPAALLYVMKHACLVLHIQPIPRFSVYNNKSYK